MSQQYDIAVIGAGAAGLTAARHAAAGGARVVVLDGTGVGGQVSTVEEIVNFPGHPDPIAGYDLGAMLLEEAEAAGAQAVLAEADSIVPDDTRFVIHAADDEFRAGAVIIAAGSTRRSLGVAGERELTGHGVSHCASCDGPFFRGGHVVVVGGGDSALDEARVLADFAADVLVVHHGDAPSAQPGIVARATDRANIRFHPNATVSAVHGDGAVAAVTIHDLASGTDTEHPARGVFVYTGLSPNTEWLGDLVDREASGHISVDADLATSHRGIFAAGDIRSGTAALLAESVADGERAARAALDHTSNNRTMRTVT